VRPVRVTENGNRSRLNMIENSSKPLFALLVLLRGGLPVPLPHFYDNKVRESELGKELFPRCPINLAGTFPGCHAEESIPGAILRCLRIVDPTLDVMRVGLLLP